MLLEVACFNIESALIAKDANADRIEFCADRSSGGTTPDLQDIIDLKAKTSIPIFAMIRPRQGDFAFTTSEIEDMGKQVLKFKPYVDGFVTGALNNDNTVNDEACRALVALADPLPCTFHRAFDHTPDLLQSLETVIYCGFKQLLTSGGPSDAIHGIEQLNKLCKKAVSRIDIIIGGGVRSTNVGTILHSTSAAAIHTAAVLGEGEIADGEEIRKLKAQLHILPQAAP